VAPRAASRVTVLLDQAVHGYEDGHRLLAASTELSSADRRLLARQTDSPDAGRVGEWDALLSGHPLPSGLFAISMTWAASEMPRPGCVWTHTLFLEQDDFGAVLPSELRLLFKRPTGPDPDLRAYRAKVTLGGQPQISLGPEEDRPWSLAMAWALYEPPAKPVRIARVDLPDPVRHLTLLRTWAAAWPSLQAILTFADAPKTPRAINDRPFDLQLHQAARIEQSSAQFRVLRGVPNATPPAWVESLVSESSKATGLSDFLAAYGPGADEDRGRMPSLVTIYMEHERETGDRDAVIRTLNTIVAAHPAKTDGARLKKDVLNPSQPPVGCQGRLDEVALLSALVSTTKSASVDISHLEVSTRARALMELDPAAVRAVLGAIEDPKQPIAEEFVAAVAETLTPAELENWARRNPEMVLDVAVRQPDLLHRPELWRAIDSTRLWPLAWSQRGSRQRLSTLVAAIGARTPLPDIDIVSRWRNGPELILKALATSKPSKSVMAEWLAAVPDPVVAKFVSEPDSSGEVLALALEQLPMSAIAKLSRERLLSIATEPELTVAGHAAMLAAALERTDDPRWAELAVTSYATVVEAARADRLGAAEERFSKIEPEMPTWDIQARLASAMNRALKAGWPSAGALAIRDKEGFRAIVEADPRAELARRILLDSADQHLAVRPWQQTILRRTISERSDRDSLVKIVETLARAAWKLRP